jgi:hypothetical protein
MQDILDELVGALAQAPAAPVAVGAPAVAVAWCTGSSSPSTSKK